jgi:ribosomal-protein-alanine N-acetyltransferase
VTEHAPQVSRIRLEHVGVQRARRLVDGQDLQLSAAPGWPHADTMDALRMDAEHATSDAETAFLVLLTSTGVVVGDAGWKGGPDAAGTVEIGYGLASSVRGQGLGTELVALLTAWALDQPGVRRVTAEVLEDNLPSRRALERCSFVLTEVTARDGCRYVTYVRPA